MYGLEADRHRLTVRSETIEAEVGRVRDEVARMADRLYEVEAENQFRKSELDAVEASEGTGEEVREQTL